MHVVLCRPHYYSAIAGSLFHFVSTDRKSCQTSIGYLPAKTIVLRQHHEILGIDQAGLFTGLRFR